MDADWSVELGADDPALEFPWTSPDAAQGYIDLANDLTGLDRIPEAMQYRPLWSFLLGLNGKTSSWLTVKCDAWMDNEVGEYTDPYPRNWRMASYVDLIRRDESQRFSFEQHERWVKAGVQRLHWFPDAPYFCELIVRRCYYHIEQYPENVTPGLYITVYVFGYGDTEEIAGYRWKGGLDRVYHALSSVMD